MSHKKSKPAGGFSWGQKLTKYPAAYVRKVRSFRWWFRWPAYIATFLVLFLLASAVIERLWQPVKNPEYGVSYSIKYANELGNDWKANYTALLKDLGFKHLRLMSYWDLLEPQPGKFDFKDLDWQIDQAKKYNVKVSLALGFRQPRWPECHEPKWAERLPADSQQWRKALYNYISKTVDHYKNSQVVESYQLENEPKNNWFGSCRGGVAPTDRLVEEFDLVKSLDQKHPVYMSLSDEHGLPLGKPVPDAYGFSIYRIVYSTNTPVHFYVTYPITIWYHKLRASYIRHFNHRPVFIHELQMEPWGPKATKELPVKEQDKSMNVDQIHKSIEYARKTGIKRMYMWGAEWWYWRMNHLHDPGPWNAVRQELEAIK